MHSMGKWFALPQRFTQATLGSCSSNVTACSLPLLLLVSPCLKYAERGAVTQHAFTSVSTPFIPSGRRLSPQTHKYS